MIVVSDTTPLHYLILIDRVHLLPELFGQVITTPDVIDEMNQQASPEKLKQWVKQLPAWLEVREPQNQLPAVARLDRGEASAISLASEIGALLLIDERDGVRVAQAAGLEVTGTLGVLLSAAREGRVSLRDSLAALARTNYRYSQKLFDELLREFESNS
ncbi:DUF3368 domain-containing protein [Lacipirellula sp.]|uniref:DUF3368 domain-containing protein n=1 Tax=Lacipirellula sp. TaxID=2691419 RepID=UPI003D1177F7